MPLKYDQKLWRVKSFVAIELPLFSKMRQVTYHSNEFTERNLILARVVQFCLLKGAFVPWEFSEVFCFSNFPTSFTSFKSAGLRKH